MTPKTALLVLAKSPRPGFVKTRLCPPATPEQAAKVAAAALLDTVLALREVPDAQPVIALSGDLDEAVDRAELRAALRDLPVIVQRGETLGERITAAHEDVAELLPGADSLQVGMDTPQISPELLGACCRALRSHGTDALLGPAADGGWWVLGLRDPRQAKVIIDVPTSRDDTGERTADALRGHGLHLVGAPELTDVDTVDDARLVAASVPGSRFAAAVRELV
ncbi:glycosyltransferase A (GT-A) superfamily protein (DUF2064 family) [Actinokineospora baliensis]|uniref:TIGR04282 family arsenosugar biosynthesis glycosyltransferase n=1 Tax=Actinokineospora baliensis TaxID=547056 RepID=UPI0019595EEB|nr:DUF2064 domain-containing protein [Actinokineospora baliensis]MBM7774287.1 glycosyltransferase A (GT-A) superfamily protein (DUF2064 family) [Actinokineospora baliensis]